MDNTIKVYKEEKELREKRLAGGYKGKSCKF